MREGHAAYCTRVASPTIFALAPTGNPQQLHPRRNAIPRAPCFLMPPQERNHPRPSRAAVQQESEETCCPVCLWKRLLRISHLRWMTQTTRTGSFRKSCPLLMSLSDENSKVKYSSEKETILAVCPFVSKETQPWRGNTLRLREVGCGVWWGFIDFVRQEGQENFADRVEPCCYPAFRGTNGIATLRKEIFAVQWAT